MADPANVTPLRADSGKERASKDALRRAPPDEPPRFGCGAVVRLKSGGPALTIRRAIKGDAMQFTVDWFGGEDEWRTADFHADQLEAWVELPPEPAPDEAFE